MNRVVEFFRRRSVAYAILALVTALSLYQGNEAIKLAREVDYSGDIRACEQENLIKRQSNDRNATLERTAKLVVDALGVISEAEDPKTSAELRSIAAEARTIQTQFDPATLIDCKSQFPKP
jgi:hypothetical protein